MGNPMNENRYLARGCQRFAVLRFSSIFPAVLRFLPIFRAVFVRFYGFNNSLRFAFSYRNLVRFWFLAILNCGFAVSIVLKIRGVLSGIKNADPSVSSFSMSTYGFLGKINEIKVVLLRILVFRFLATFLRGFAVFAEILCGFAVSGAPLTPPF